MRQNDPVSNVEIRDARPEELNELGELVSKAYASLPGMPRVDEQPTYYQMLRNAEQRSRNPANHILAAVDDSGDLVGCVDFIDDMKHYGSGGIATEIVGAAGIRLLAVKPECRGRGIGKALTRQCIARARSAGMARVILHTTRAMQSAWVMYERLGFERLPSLDFQQEKLEVFGFQLRIE